MTKLFAVGDLVNVLPPFDDDPYIVRLQPHARVAAVLRPAADEEPSYMIALLAVSANCGPYGPFPAHRLTPGSWARLLTPREHVSWQQDACGLASNETRRE